jgi:hypothetical protein
MEISFEKLANDIDCEAKRAQGMPGEGLTHGPPADKRQAAVTTGSAGSSGGPCAMVLTLSFALPGSWLRCDAIHIDARGFWTGTNPVLPTGAASLPLPLTDKVIARAREDGGE